MTVISVEVSKVFLFARDSGKLCLEKRRDGSRFSGKLGLLGGTMDEGEKPSETLVREVREEVAATVAPIAINSQHYLVPYHDGRPSKDMIIHYFVATVQTESDVVPTHECPGVEWHSIDNLPHERLIGEIAEYIEAHREQIEKARR